MICIYKLYRFSAKYRTVIKDFALEVLQNEENLNSKVDLKVLFITTDSWLAQLGSRKNKLKWSTAI